MNMHNFVFQDTNFDNNRSLEYDLSIQLSLDGFSFSIYKDNRCLALKRFDLKKEIPGKQGDHLKELILNEPLLNKPYQSIKAIWVTPRATLIPSALFSEETAESYFCLCHPLSRDHLIMWQEVPRIDACLVYSIPMELMNFMRNQFPDLQLSHHSIPFFEMAQSDTNGNHSIVNISVHQNFIDILIIEKDHQHFFNTFAYRNPADLVYYVINVYSQCKLNTSESRLILSGDIDSTDETSCLLKKYFSQVEFT